MAEQIWKYQLHLVSKQMIDVPEGAEVVHVGEQGKLFCVWLQVDPEAAKVQKTVYCLGTGEDIPGNAEHIGTIVRSTAEVLHFFLDMDFYTVLKRSVSGL